MYIYIYIYIYIFIQINNCVSMKQKESIEYLIYLFISLGKDKLKFYWMFDPNRQTLLLESEKRQTNRQTHIQTYTQRNTKNKCARARAHSHTHKHTHTYTHIHTHTHTHKHTRTDRHKYILSCAAVSGSNKYSSKTY